MMRFRWRISVALLVIFSILYFVPSIFDRPLYEHTEAEFVGHVVSINENRFMDVVAEWYIIRPSYGGFPASMGMGFGFVPDRIFGHISAGDIVDVISVGDIVHVQIRDRWMGRYWDRIFVVYAMKPDFGLPQFEFPQFGMTVISCPSAGGCA